MVVADDLDDDDFHFLFRSELPPVVLPDPRSARTSGSGLVNLCIG